MFVILPMTQLLCDLNLEVVLTQLEESSKLVIAWFQNNYMKLNTDKCHLLVAGHKSEHIWVTVGLNKIWEDHSIKLLEVSIDNELKFKKKNTLWPLFMDGVQLPQG